MDQAEAIREIEEGKQRFYVSIGAREIEVVIALSRRGDKYLKTEMDGEQPTRLLSLYECT